MEALGPDGSTSNLIRHTETYPDLATLTLWIQDTHPVWERDRDGTRFEIPPEDVLVRVEELPIPLGVTWELLHQPTKASENYQSRIRLSRQPTRP
jgi:hypothetical protein